MNQPATAIVSDTTPPAITDLKWTPTRAQNSKVYDGQVTFEASDTQSGLSNASLDWEPIYPTQISKAAIPLEDTNHFSLVGTTASSLGRNASFEQVINDLKGGKEYSAMSEYQLQRYSDPYTTLLDNSHDETAWRQIFGANLDRRVCTVVIRERWDYKLYGSYSKSHRETEDYEREVSAYC